MNTIPHEFAIGGVYFPPLLIAGILGTIAAFITAHLLKRYRLSNYFFYPPAVFLALSLFLHNPGPNNRHPQKLINSTKIQSEFSKGNIIHPF